MTTQEWLVIAIIAIGAAAIAVNSRVEHEQDCVQIGTGGGE